VHIHFSPNKIPSGPWYWLIKKEPTNNNKKFTINYDITFSFYLCFAKGYKVINFHVLLFYTFVMYYYYFFYLAMFNIIYFCVIIFVLSGPWYCIIFVKWNKWFSHVLSRGHKMLRTWLNPIVTHNINSQSFILNWLAHITY
jgi:hypothetical protein